MSGINLGGFGISDSDVKDYSSFKNTSSTGPVNLKSFGIDTTLEKDVNGKLEENKVSLSRVDRAKVAGAKVLIGMLGMLIPKDKKASYYGPIQSVPEKGETITV